METDRLHWPLLILSRAVHFKNLTGASAHVGLSQPQLSRLISQLENELQVTLLDRSAKRKSSWTPAAMKIAEVYVASSRRLQSSIAEVLTAQVPTQVVIGSLEGLSYLSLILAKDFFTNSKVTHVETDIFDQNELEEKFLNGDLDLMITSRSPSKQKFKHNLEIGYQTFEVINAGEDYQVLSPYEFGRMKKKPSAKTFISNSLALRKSFLQEYGGQGALPTAVQKSRGKDMMPVLLIGAELFHEKLWERCLQVFK